MSARYAVIDVGTNTVRLLVAEQEDGRLIPTHTDKELVRLGRDLAHDSRISDESLLHVSDALRRYAGVARKLIPIQRPDQSPVGCSRDERSQNPNCGCLSE